MAKSMKEIFQPIISATRDLLTKKILTKSLDYYSGIETKLQNPDRVITDNNKDLKLYDLMLLDDKIKNTLDIFKRMVTSVGGDFIPASKDPIDKEICEFVKDVFDNMKIRFWDVFDNMLDARAYGFKCGEIMWDVRDGKVVIENIKFKHSLYFDFDYDEYSELSEVRVGYRVGKDTAVSADEFKQKFLYFVNPYLKDQNYYGESDLMAVYGQWRAKVQISRFRNMYLQNYGFPIPVGVYDSASTTKQEVEDLKEYLEKFQEQMFFLIPGKRGADGKLNGKIQIDFHKVETTGGSGAFSETIDQLDKQIARKLLIPDKAGFTESAGGSYNLGENQFDVLKMFIVDYQGRLEDVINALVKQLVDYNYPNVKAYPEWGFQSDESKLTYEMLNTLIQNKIIDKREKWIRKFVGIPELDQDEQKEIDEANRLEPPSPIPSFRPVFFKEKFKRESPTNFKKIKEQYDTKEEEFVSKYVKLMKQIQIDVVNQVKKKGMIENQDAIKTLRIPKTDIKNLFSNYFAEMYISGKVDGIDEIETKLNKVKKELMQYEQFKPDDDLLWLDREWVDKYLKKYGELGTLSKKDKKYLKNYREKAFYITGETEQDVINTVQKTIASGVRNGLSTDVIVSKIAEDLSAEREKYALTIARTNAADTYNSGRMNMFLDDKVSPYIEAYQYSAILDDVTTPFCADHDGQIIKPSDPEFGRINPPNHFNAILPDESILTIDGEKKICDIAVGDYVRTHTGKFQAVYDIMMEYRDEDIYEIELENGQKLKLTGEHPVLTDTGWKNASDLNESDSVRFWGQKRTINYCKTCGVEIKQKGKKKNKNYCSQKCMSAGYRKNNISNCTKCGKPMISKWKSPVSKNRKFCSQKCYFSYKGRTSIEQKMAETLTKIGIEFEEQYKIGRYFVDFYIPSHNILIECDGNYWHDIKENKEKRIKRDRILSSDFMLYRIGQDDILSDKLESELIEIFKGE